MFPNVCVDVKPYSHRLFPNVSVDVELYNHHVFLNVSVDVRPTVTVCSLTSLWTLSSTVTIGSQTPCNHLFANELHEAPANSL